MSPTFRLLPLLAGVLVLGATACGHAGSARPRILFLSDRDGDWALYTMDAGGGNERRVFPAGHVEPFGAPTGSGAPAVSPDGRSVLLARRGVTVATLATGASRRLGAGEAADAGWSPDGRRVAFSGPDNRGLYVVDARGGRPRTLLRKPGTYTPAWSPDGKSIAFARQLRAGPVEIWTVRPDGTGLRRLTRYAPNGPGGLAWSRDGKLAFIGSRENEQLAHLVVVDVDTRRVDLLQSRLGNGTVAWSPDGRRIAYAATPANSDVSSISIVGADGRDRRRLTPSQPPHSDGSPVWAPDGKSLLFVRTPFGGGAASGVPQVWTMRADGSHQRPLTTAYPDGGENLEPAWVGGAVHTDQPPRTEEVRRGDAVVLKVPFAIDGIAAEGGRAAIAPVTYEEQRQFQPSPPVLVWRPGRGEPARLVTSPCGGVQQLVLTRGRLALDCDGRFLDLIEQSLWVYDLSTRVPREVFLGRGGPDESGLFLDNVVGGGGLLAFGSERDDSRGRARLRTVWRIDGFDSLALHSSPKAGDLAGAGGGRLVVQLAAGHVAILTADGAQIHVLALAGHRPVFADPFGFDRTPPFVLVGRNLIVLERGKLRAYDTRTGRLRWERRVQRRARLEGADGRLVVYTAGSSVHVVSPAGETVIHTGAPRLHRLRFIVPRPLHAALSADGLYYCFNVADRRYPGRVVFVPRAALMR